MDVRSFTDSVYGLWGHAWPSLTYLLLIWISLAHCFPASYGQWLNFFQRHVAERQGSNPIRGFLKTIGAPAAYPVVVAIVILLTFKIVGFVIFASEWLPPNLICEDYRIAYPVFSPADLERLASLFPDADGFQAAYSRALVLLGGDAEAREGYKLYMVLPILAKAVILTVGITFCVCVRRERQRGKCVRGCLYVMTVAALVWGVCTIVSLPEHEAEVQATADRLTVKIREHALQEKWLAPSQTSTKVPLSLFLNDDGARWWKLDCTLRYRLWSFWRICFPLPKTSPTALPGNTNLVK